MPEGLTKAEAVGPPRGGAAGATAAAAGAQRRQSDRVQTLARIDRLQTRDITNSNAKLCLFNR